MISSDEGRTWNEPQPLVEGDEIGRGPVKDKPILLHDGTWLAGASVETDDRWDLFIDRSQDGGATWRATELAQPGSAACARQRCDSTGPVGIRTGQGASVGAQHRGRRLPL
jgi:predicted neuraminidase